MRFVRAVAAFLALAGAVSASAQTSPNGFYVENVTPDESLFFPTDIALAPDGTAYVAHKQGWISVVDPDGTVRPDRFLDIQSEVHSAVDRGLLGIALDPGFPAQPYLYLYYMRLDATTADFDTPFTHGRLERVTAVGEGLARADLSSRVVLLGQEYTDAPVGCQPFHGGATVAFAPDGSLLLSTGDGASAGPPDAGGLLPECFAPERADPANDLGAFRAQRLESLNGKVLRLDPETGLGLPDNPFWTGDATDTASKVWAMGLRNPFRLSVQPEAGGSFRVAVGDVGWYSYEEVNLARGGENFGWPCSEGIAPRDNYAAIAPAGYACDEIRELDTAPVAQWSHSDAARSIPAGLTAQSVTGGAFYDGGAFPDAYDGALFVADFASEWLMAIQFEEGAVVSAERVLEDVGAIVDVEVHPTDGSLLLLDILGGRILRLRNTGAGEAAPVARGVALPASGAAPLPVTFSAEDSFDPSGGTLTAAWSFGDGATGTGASVDHTYAEPGEYTVTLTVTSTSGRATQTTLPVRVGVSVPQIEIVAPVAGFVFEGEQVLLRAEVSDAVEPDETLSVAWEARIVHNGHEHPGVSTAEGTAAMLPIVPHGSPQELTYYTVTATVLDAEGLSSAETVALPVVAPGTVVGAGKPVWSDDGLAELEQTVAVRGMVFADTLTAAAVEQIEVREDGTWRAPAFAQGVPAEGGTLVLFVEAHADAVRVGPGAGTPDLVIALGADASGFELGTAGAEEAAGALAATETGFALQVDGGPQPTFAYRALGDANGVDAEVRPGLGTGRAGVALLSSLDPSASRVELTVDDVGNVEVREPDGTSQWLAQSALPVRLRLSQGAEAVVAELSEDGETWRDVARVAYGEPRAPLGGLVAQSSTAFIARFDSLRLGVVEAPAPIEDPKLAIRSIVPNPTAGSVDAEVAVALPGTYRAELFDALGRLVSSVGWVAAEPQAFMVPFRLEDAAPGVYSLRVRHLESGAAVFERVTRVR